jgi:hypothetical protein
VITGAIGRNAYAERFAQGATIVPRSFYFVSVDQDFSDSELKHRTVHVETCLLPEAKPPWKNLALSGRVEGEYLFRTALSKNIFPFALVRPPLVLLPVAIENGDTGGGKFALFDHEGLMRRGSRYASEWFWNAHKLWEENRTEKAAKSELSLLRRLDFQRGLTQQDPGAQYLVIYTAAASDASAVVVDVSEMQLPFVVDHMAYWCRAESAAEAHYVCGYLNSGYANRQIKEFQSRGLFGPRHVHKTILKLPFPKFDSRIDLHKELASLSEKCSEVARDLILHEGFTELEAHALGRARVRLREGLAGDMSAIDEMLAVLSTGRSDAAVRASGKGLTRPRRSRNLFE